MNQGSTVNHRIGLWLSGAKDRFRLSGLERATFGMNLLSQLRVQAHGCSVHGFGASGFGFSGLGFQSLGFWTFRG